jgi:hypothetical protein
MVDRVSGTRGERAEALERWADDIDSADLKVADTDALRSIAELVEQRNEVDEDLTEAVRSARRAERSWAEIGAMLGVSKQAAQRKYAKGAASDS